MQALETTLKDHLLNRQITDLVCYNLNDMYLAFDQHAHWVFDSGIQLTLNDGFFSFGWNSEFDGFDYSTEQTIEEMNTSEQLYAIDTKHPVALAALIGATIEQVAFQWDYYQEYDEFAQLKEEKLYEPVEIRLTTNQGHVLQLAAIRYSIDHQTKQIRDARFDLTGELLVSWNNPIVID